MYRPIEAGKYVFDTRNRRASKASLSHPMYMLLLASPRFSCGNWSGLNFGQENFNRYEVEFAATSRLLIPIILHFQSCEADRDMSESGTSFSRLPNLKSVI